MMFDAEERESAAEENERLAYNEAGRLQVSNDELVAALIRVLAIHRQKEPHHEDMCAACRSANTALKNASRR